MAIVCDACHDEDVATDGDLCGRCAESKARCRQCNEWHDNKPVILCWDCAYKLYRAALTDRNLSHGEAWIWLANVGMAVATDADARQAFRRSRELCIGFVERGWRLADLDTTFGVNFTFARADLDAEVKVTWSPLGSYVKVNTTDPSVGPDRKLFEYTGWPPRATPPGLIAATYGDPEFVRTLARLSLPTFIKSNGDQS